MPRVKTTREGGHSGKKRKGKTDPTPGNELLQPSVAEKKIKKDTDLADEDTARKLSSSNGFSSNDILVSNNKNETQTKREFEIGKSDISPDNHENWTSSLNSSFRRVTRSRAKQLKLTHTGAVSEGGLGTENSSETVAVRPKLEGKGISQPNREVKTVDGKGISESGGKTVERKVSISKNTQKNGIKKSNKKIKERQRNPSDQENIKPASPAEEKGLINSDQTSVSFKQREKDKKSLSSKKVKLVALKTDEESIEMKKFVGAHLSISGGLENIIKGAREIGAEAVGLFLKSQRSWKSKPLEEKTVEKFKKACQDYNFPTSMILPHGSYLLNCGSHKADLLAKSRESLIDDLHRCERLGIQLFNFHPGSTCGEISVDECVSRIAESINMAHTQTKQVTVLIENMSCQGHTIGGRFEELRDIIALVKDKDRVGVCLDTCHAFAAGFNLKTETGYEQMMTDFDNIIGLQYLKAVHLNDSKGDVGCHKDRHENIGKGKIGLEGFRHVMKDERLNNIPMILETPLTIDDSDEIKLLYSLRTELLYSL